MNRENFMKLKFGYKFYLYLGVIGAIAVGFGEYLLHFNPNGPAGEIDMLLDSPLDRARMGHYFAIVGVPFYFAGYYGLLKLFKSSNEFLAKSLFIGGIWSFFVGATWITSRYLGAVILQKSVGTADYSYFYAQYEENYQILVWALRVLVGGVSILYILNIWKNKVGIPKWLVILNPIVLLVLVISTLAWAKPLGIYIAPVAMNTTHFIFFLLMIKFSDEKKVNQ